MGIAASQAHFACPELLYVRPFFHATDSAKLAAITDLVRASLRLINS